MPHLLLGQVLSFHANPFHTDPLQAAHIETHGAVLIDQGRILATGPAVQLRPQHPQATVHDYGQALISPGFIDAHVHYPQTPIIASWGKRLIDWLNTYTFPQEARFHDPNYALDIANRYCDLTLAHGTTSFCTYTTIHPTSVDAIFTAAQTRRQRIWAGKTCMDRNAPDNLLDTPKSAYDDSKALLQKWHAQDRLSYVITPRFSPTSTPEQLHALGSLWREYPDCLMQTHLSEQLDEIAWVKDLFPQSRDYLDTYEAQGLLGERALYGHSIHLTPREIARLTEAGASLIHCPTSNAFIGSGLFDMTLAKTLRTGLATDTGGGSSFSMLRTMAAAYDIAQLRGQSLHPAQLWWLATQGSARALHADHQIGNIAPGMEADLTILDLASTPAIAQAVERAETPWQALFPTVMMGDDRAIRAVWVGGEEHRQTAP
ncbi:guanine deaminase [Neogemmobacter tilapiae]|uniref:Guanine deaminase n=1 Tax=Neogemmobacter tilapiae TaxID=875041 RepID=A0A918TPZ6_9RHOB|nr:guanine deaminase [Gemmobacter tilapiae]GHC57420.1 guanine deaminase [Gemmobacter tilapiae]